MGDILVTGGAGYIGSVAGKMLVERGYNVIVVDNLSKGLKELVDPKAKFYELDLVEYDSLRSVFEENSIEVVMHFGSYKAPGESMENPLKYTDNTVGLINLLNLMKENSSRKIIFSSSCSIYGDSKYVPIDENHAKAPVSFYGFTKLEGEKIIEDYSKAYNLNYAFLRYFNVVGDAGLNYIDPSPLNIVPLIMEVIFGEKEKLTIFGSDYDTPDGTCIRDYVDVSDLVEAHILAIDHQKNDFFNLGTGVGVSVKELVDFSESIHGNSFNFEYGPRRLGDPAKVFASNEKAVNELGWSPKKNYMDSLKEVYLVYKKRFG